MNDPTYIWHRNIQKNLSQSSYRGKSIWHFPKLTITCGQFVYTMAVRDILRTSNTNMTFMPFMAHYANCTSIVSYS